VSTAGPPSGELLGHPNGRQQGVAADVYLDTALVDLMFVDWAMPPSFALSMLVATGPNYAASIDLHRTPI
jgi:hypothetical protein